jgi:lauroyl/myristoyl acyltransferase
MSSLELAVATLRSLPESFQGRAVEFIHKLHAANRQERREALRKTAGCLTEEEADEMKRAIEESFENLDGQ